MPQRSGEPVSATRFPEPKPPPRAIHVAARPEDVGEERVDGSRLIYRLLVAGEIRYQPNGDNSILKLALYEAYGAKCYSCGRPQEFAQVEIDHIVPRSTAREDLQEWVSADRLQGYDLDAVYNLARPGFRP